MPKESRKFLGIDSCLVKFQFLHSVIYPHIYGYIYALCFQSVQLFPAESRCSCCWLWNVRRTGLLVSEKLLGDHVGIGRLHHDVKEQEQPVWNRYRCHLSSRVIPTRSTRYQTTFLNLRMEFFYFFKKVQGNSFFLTLMRQD